MNSYLIRPIRDDDREWISDLLIKHRGSSAIVTRGRIHQGDLLPGFIAEEMDEKVGLITYNIENKKCEITSLNSIVEGIGIGSNLIEEVKRKAAASGCSKIWCITTNDNRRAIRFYRKRGFEVTAVHRDALEESRKIIPEIAFVGFDGIEIKDEILLEIEIR